MTDATFYEIEMARVSVRAPSSERASCEAERLCLHYDRVASRGYDPSTGETGADLYRYAGKRWSQYRKSMLNQPWGRISE